MGELKHKELTEQVLGVFYDVYNKLGHGFLESVYEKALIIALNAAGLQSNAQVPITVYFEGHNVGDFKADIIVENVVILELKAAKNIEDVHISQTLNYLKATNIDVGLILNFGPKPTFKRLLFDRR